MNDDKPTRDIFISYSRKNKDVVLPITDEMERLGLTCWIDLSDIPCGTESFKKIVIPAIRQTRVAFLFFLSAESQSSEYAMKEINFAKKRAKKRVILVRFNDDEMTDEFFFDFQDADIIDWRVPEQKAKLLRDLKAWSSGDGGQLPGSPDNNAESKINDKYRQLKTKDIEGKLGSAVAPGICQTSDGGWQCDYVFGKNFTEKTLLGLRCAITLRPGDEEAHEVHGGILKRWYDEGGIHKLGYPISDEEVYEVDGDDRDRISHFEYGDIVWKGDGSNETRIINVRVRSDVACKAGMIKTITLPGGAEMELVWCPPGEFTMGSPQTEEGRSVYETQHCVRLTNGFWMGKYPVTQRQWKSVMGRCQSHFKGDDLPVESVSWNDIQAFIKKVNEAFRYGARLPTEAEWEYACRAGTATAYSWGNALNGDKANCAGTKPYGTSKRGPYLKKTSPVGKYGANPWGLYDMHGNVYEWCVDRYGSYPAGRVVDPQGPALGDQRVLRGGCWESFARDCRSAHRAGRRSGFRHERYGFRLCCSALPNDER